MMAREGSALSSVLQPSVPLHPPQEKVYINDANFDRVPYQEIEVTFGGEPYEVYIGTETGELLFDPMIYSGSGKSNKSAVFSFKRMDRQPIPDPRVYRVQSVVFQDPDQTSAVYLTMSRSVVGMPNGQPARRIVLQTISSSAQVFRAVRPDDSSLFAYSITDRGATYYLTPVSVASSIPGQMRLMIVGVRDSSPDNHYVFRNTPSDYQPPTSVVPMTPLRKAATMLTSSYTKLTVEVKGKRGATEEYICYASTDKMSIHYPSCNQTEQKNFSTVMRITQTDRQNESYTISSAVFPDSYLQVTDSHTSTHGSKKRAVKFTELQGGQPSPSQQFVIAKCDTKFALHTTVVDSKGHTRTYYLKPESGSIVAEESSTPDGYYYFSKNQIPFHHSDMAPMMEATETVQIETTDISNTVTSADTVMINDLKLKESITIESSGPLTTEQLEQEASKPNQLFLMRFPSQNNKLAYVDVNDMKLQVSQKATSDLSVLMKLQTTSSDDSPQYKWSTVIFPEAYYSVTSPGIGGYTQVVFEPSTDQAWRVQATGSDHPPNLNPPPLVFQQTVTTPLATWYLNTISTSSGRQGSVKQVIAWPQAVSAGYVNVYHVTNYDANTLPMASITPPPGGNNEEES